MDTAILAGVVRHVLTTLGGMLVAKGYIGADAAAALVDWGVGGALLLGGIAWSILSKRFGARQGGQQ